MAGFVPGLVADDLGENLSRLGAGVATCSSSYTTSSHGTGAVASCRRGGGIAGWACGWLGAWFGDEDEDGVPDDAGACCEDGDEDGVAGDGCGCAAAGGTAGAGAAGTAGAGGGADALSTLRRFDLLRMASGSST